MKEIFNPLIDALIKDHPDWNPVCEEDEDGFYIVFKNSSSFVTSHKQCWDDVIYENYFKYIKEVEKNFPSNGDFFMDIMFGNIIIGFEKDLN